MLRQITYDEAQGYISREPEKCLNLSGKLFVGEAECYTDEGFTGLLLKNGDEISLYTENEGFIDAAIAQLGKSVYFFGCIEESVAKSFFKRYKPRWRTYCRIFKYPYKEVPKVAVPDAVTLAPIDLKFLDLIDEKYTFRGEGTREKLKGEITARQSSAVYLADGQIAAWTLIHDDYAMGVMYVLPEYRRRGYAAYASVDLMKKVIDSGFVPYVQILHNNKASLALAESLGFRQICSSYWFELKLK